MISHDRWRWKKIFNGCLLQGCVINKYIYIYIFHQMSHHSRYNEDRCYPLCSAVLVHRPTRPRPRALKFRGWQIVCRYLFLNIFFFFSTTTKGSYWGVCVCVCVCVVFNPSFSDEYYNSLYSALPSYLATTAMVLRMVLQGVGWGR